VAAAGVELYSEAWRARYANSRYLEFLSVDGLGQRYIDLLDNVRVYAADGMSQFSDLSADTGWTRGISDVHAEVQRAVRTAVAIKLFMAAPDLGASIRILNQRSDRASVYTRLPALESLFDEHDLDEPARGGACRFTCGRATSSPVDLLPGRAVSGRFHSSDLRSQAAPSL
jgi:hypothetical protein